MSKKHGLYVGSSGQLAVMSEFLVRGYNAAIPQVDVGDDIFVVRDTNGELFRIQVKTALAKQRKGNGFTATFNVAERQLSLEPKPELHFVFAVRHRDRWAEFVVIDRKDLYNLYENQCVGSKSGDAVVIRLGFVADKVSCNRVDLSSFRGNWSKWPAIVH